MPTRELAQQIDQQMEGFSYFTPVSSIAVYGGGDGALFAQEKKALSVKGTEMVICTPGRMIAHLNNNYVKFDGLKYLILDEADRMLDMGFHEDIMKIIQYLPKKRQNLMFAATMPDDIRKLARKVLHDPVELNIAISKPAEKILQVAYVVYETQKLPLVNAPAERARPEKCYCILLHQVISQAAGPAAEKRGTDGPGYPFRPGPENPGGDYA